MSIDFDLDLLRDGGAFHYSVVYDMRADVYVCTVDRFPGLQYVAADPRDAMESLMRVIRRIVYAKEEQYHGIAGRYGVVKPLDQMADRQLLLDLARPG